MQSMSSSLYGGLNAAPSLASTDFLKLRIGISAESTPNVFPYLFELPIRTATSIYLLHHSKCVAGEGLLDFVISGLRVRRATAMPNYLVQTLHDPAIVPNLTMEIAIPARLEHGLISSNHATEDLQFHDITRIARQLAIIESGARPAN